MTMGWNFGQPILFEPSQLPNAYEYGFNYQCPRIFVENFVHASQDLERQVKTEIPDINIKQQERLHLSLAYFCCLRRNETDWVREITQEWIHHHHPFDFTVKFNKLECWHERHNSVTNIIVGDDATQSVLMKMLHDLYDTIHRRAGIKMEIPRENQMPFHVTLSGIFYGTKEEGDNIRPQIPVIHKLVSKISQRFGDRWAGYHGMRITHDPKVRSQGTWHAGNQPTN
jgi:ribosomal protein L17